MYKIRDWKKWTFQSKPRRQSSISKCCHFQTKMEDNSLNLSIFLGFSYLRRYWLLFIACSEFFGVTVKSDEGKKRRREVRSLWRQLTSEKKQKDYNQNSSFQAAQGSETGWAFHDCRGLLRLTVIHVEICMNKTFLWIVTLSSKT